MAGDPSGSPAEAAAASTGTERRVLIVDDDPVFGLTLARALDNRGYYAVTAQNSQAALELCNDFVPDYLLLDLRIGEENGLQLIRPMLEQIPTLHILMLTGFASIATAVRAIKLGAADYLAKPVDAEMVDQALQKKIATVSAPAVNSSADSTKMMSVERLEWEHIQRVLADNDGNVSAAARSLNMHRRTLQRKLAKRPRRQ
ncbi:MAG: response regulator [Immundisolibacteraceae bacterium]|nr:response regulator [Immundisolibacteraceae bacterium]